MVTLSEGKIPNVGNRRTGNSEVTPIGSASRIQKRAINTTTKAQYAGLKQKLKFL